MNRRRGLNIIVTVMILLLARQSLDAQRHLVVHPQHGRISDQRAASTPPRVAHQADSDNAVHLAALPPQYRDCTSIAFQEWRDDNWEIYLASGDGTTPQRLTDNVTDDEAPAMAQGCGQIVYSADHDDNQDIYVMQADGRNVTRLTSQPARDVLPALSPDGTTIAFQSYRHGDEPEIYLFDLATHIETRITNDQTYDGQPDFSPDGQQIAFISDRSGERNIWVMNRDGTDIQQLTWLTHAAAPKWSSEGEHIAFASDDLGNGFTALWIVGADGSDPHLVIRAEGSQSDAWPDDWSYDNQYIIFEEAAWEYDNGWYITDSSLDIIDPQQTDDRQRLVTGGVSMAAAWTLCDLDAPLVAMAELPHVSQSPISVAWSGEDTHSSTITYQVQYRPGGATSWSTWQVSPGQDWTTLTSGQFAWHTLGGTIAFRVRAMDIMGHVSDWAPSASGWLTTLPAQVGGTVYDARGIPLGNALVSCAHSPLDDALTDSWGNFQLLAAGSSAPRYSASIAQMEPQSLHLPEFTNIQGLRYWLTTAGGALPNGGFELGLAGWYAEGTVSIIEADLSYGQRCALMGKAALCATPDILARTLIEQPVSVPSSYAHPTLSLAYALGDGTVDPAGEMAISIATEQGPKQVFATDMPTVWETTPAELRFPLWDAAHIDLSAWSGQDVVIAITHQKELGHGMMLVDQVSVTDWQTPFITSVTPASVTVGASADVHIEGHNLSADTAVRVGDRDIVSRWTGTDLVITLPDDLAQGLYPVWVTNADGLSSVRRQGISIGGYAVVPLIISP